MPSQRSGLSARGDVPQRDAPVTRANPKRSVAGGQGPAVRRERQATVPRTLPATAVRPVHAPRTGPIASPSGRNSTWPRSCRRARRQPSRSAPNLGPRPVGPVPSSGPFRSRTRRPGAARASRKSPIATARVLPAGENAAKKSGSTAERRRAAPSRSYVPELPAFMSSLAEARVLPSGENARDRTPLVWATNLVRSLCPAKSQTRVPGRHWSPAVCRRARTRRRRSSSSTRPRGGRFPCGWPRRRP